MTYRCVSSKVFKRFPTFQHLVDAGIMENEEKILVEQAQKKSEFLAYCHWMPFSWASSLTFQAYQNGHIKKELYNWDIQKEIVIVKDFCNAIISYLSRGVLPETLRRGPYAVVDELVLVLSSTTVVKSHQNC